MKDSVRRPSIKDVLTVRFRLKSESDCRSSWQDLTSCQILLPPRSGLTARLSGGSGTDLALFQSIVDRPTSTVGLTGQIIWKASTQSRTMVSIILAVGQTEFIVARISARKSFVLGYYVSRRPTRNPALLRRSRAPISGVSKISDTTLTNEQLAHGLTTLFAFTIKALIRVCASSGPGMARLLQSIYRLLAIVSPVTLWGRCFGQTRNY